MWHREDPDCKVGRMCTSRRRRPCSRQNICINRSATKMQFMVAVEQSKMEGSGQKSRKR